MTDTEISIATLLRIRDMEHVGRFMLAGDALCPTEKYTHFVSAHFSPSKQQDAEHHAKHFRNVFDRKLCGRGRRLYKVLFIEEGDSYSFNQRHAHWLIHKPAGLSEREFCNSFQACWYEICGSKNVVIKPILKKSGGIEGLISYLTKQRDVDGVIGNCAFIKECSDNTARQQHKKVHAESCYWASTRKAN